MALYIHIYMYVYIYIYLYAAGCLIEPQFFTLFARNLRKRSAKTNFLSKEGPKMVATFRVQLSIHECWLHFCPFFPLFSGENRVFALLLLPEGPETQGARRFFWGGGPKHGEKRVCCEKSVRNAGGIWVSDFCCFIFPLWVVCMSSLFHLVLMFVVLCRGGPLEKEAAEAGAEGSLKKHKKKQKKKNKKSLSFSRFPLFLFSFLFLLYTRQTKQNNHNNNNNNSNNNNNNNNSNRAQNKTTPEQHRQSEEEGQEEETRQGKN